MRVSGSGLVCRNVYGKLHELSLGGAGACAPYNGTIPAVFAERIRLAKKTGMQIMELVKKDIRPSQILTTQAFENACQWTWPSEDRPIRRFISPRSPRKPELNSHSRAFNEISGKTPHLCSMSPGGPHHLQDLHQAGGIPALIAELIEAGLDPP